MRDLPYPQRHRDAAGKAAQRALHRLLRADLGQLGAAKVLACGQKNRSGGPSQPLNILMHCMAWDYPGV